MAASNRNKKRTLPQWMKALKEQGERNKVSKYSGADRNLQSEKFNKNSAVLNDYRLKEPQSASEIISENMPLLRYEGPITYSYHESDCACICLDILSRLREDLISPTVIGFDTEWPVTFVKGTSSKTAVIQMCLSELECYLFQVSCMPSIPKPLQNLILDKRVTLVGVNIESDLWKLSRDYDISVKSVIDQGTVVDLSKLANKKLKSSERWSLDGLCRNILRKRLDKDTDLRCGDWTDYPLSKDQQIYACSDALAGLELYKHLVATEK